MEGMKQCGGRRSHLVGTSAFVSCYLDGGKAFNSGPYRGYCSKRRASVQCGALYGHRADALMQGGS
jgi:hypothetical protein